MEKVENKDISEKIAKRIEDLCNEKGYSYYKLEERSAVPLSTLLKIVKGTTKNPRIKTIIQICGGLDMEIKEFFDTEDFYGCMYDAE